MKNIFTLLTFYFLFYYCGYSQNLNYAPTTPEVASLGKFIETPVSYYSGIPNISIPLITISEGELSIPVSLNYHAGGIRVEEDASWVGTGWNLSAGGLITRVVRGIPDDHSGGFLNTIKTVDNFLSLNINTSENVIRDLIDQSLDGYLDYEPDVFHYNFLGYSGSFFMSQSGDIISMPHDDIFIEPRKDIYNEIIGWIIKTPVGDTFYFGKSKDDIRTGYERILSTIALGGGKNITQGYINGWYLLDINNSTNKKIIKLSYTENRYDTCSRSGQERYVNGQGEISTPTNTIKPIIYYDNRVLSSKIASIETSNGKLVFVKGETERVDQPGDYALKEIILKDINDIEIKKFKFTYENKGQIGSLVNVPCSGDERYFRLFLMSVQEFSGNKSINPFVFDYNKNMLPEKFSFAQDFWGYYNGKENNQNLIPSITVRGVRYLGADKTSNSNFSKAGVLEKVTYPTKGYTKYEYEGNTVSQLSFANEIAPRIQETITTITTAKVLESNHPNFYSESFTVRDNEYLEDIIFVDVNFPCDVTTRTCGIGFSLIKSDGTFSVDFTQDANFSISPGEYTITGHLWGDDFGNYPDIQIRLYGEKVDLESLTTDGISYEVGGLRIKNIKKNDSDGTLAFEKTYDYKDPISLGSSGSITSIPLFVEYFAPLMEGQGGAIINAAADIISSASNSPFTSSQSNYVGYSDITEYFGTPENNSGKKEYQFSFNSDDDSGLDSSPGGSVNSLLGVHAFPPRVILEWLRGSLLEERVYVNNEGIFDIIKRTMNVYTYYRNPNDIFKKNIIGIKLGRRNDFRTFKKYSTLSEWFKLDHSLITSYYDSNEVTVRKEYTYNENEQKHIKPIIEKTINSSIEEYKSNFYYPQDLINPTAAEQALIIDYKIGVPIKTEILKNNELLSSQYTIYNDQKWLELNLPEIIQTAKGEISQTNQLENRAVFHDYYANGNVKEVSKEDGTHIVYIWGYNETQPIAKIENATFAEVSSYIINLQTKSNLDIDAISELTFRDALNNLRNPLFAPNLSKSQITTYTYDPLIGVTSITDPRGETIYYHYDNFNRLEFVKDAQGKILSKNEYHYKNQQ